MTVTVLYPEDRQIPDLAVEQKIFGADVRLIRATRPSFAELDPADCAAADGLMIMRWAVTAADLDRFPQLRCVVRMGVGYDKLDRLAAAARPQLEAHRIEGPDPGQGRGQLDQSQERADEQKLGHAVFPRKRGQ